MGLNWSGEFLKCKIQGADATMPRMGRVVLPDCDNTIATIVQQRGQIYFGSSRSLGEERVDSQGSR